MFKGKDLRISVAGSLLAGVVLLAGVFPTTLSAQDMDARWLPWLGCWEAADGGGDAPLLCVRPATQGDGVEFVTWAEGMETASEVILADGVPRNVDREECRGVEEARFSNDGRRIYLSSEYVCEGEIEREASGILAMVNPMEWVDIKAVDGTPWVLRYRLARASVVEAAGMENVVASRASAVKAARISASGRLTEANIIEASANVEAAAVEALIVERGDPFAVDAAMLIRLADAGVPESVIDLTVAISFPERFAVKAGAIPIEEYATDDAMTPRRRIYMGGMGMDPYGRYGWGYSPFGYGYGYGSYGYGYGYGGYGYGGYGYPYYRPAPVVVQPRTPATMIKGQGYTRGGSSGSSGQARPRSGSAGSSGGTRATSSPGVSSSGGSRSTGRTAKPRGGGGSGGVSSSITTSSSPPTSSSPVRMARPRTGGGGLI